MFPDFKELLSAFNAHRVKYLIVGGYAVSFHAQPRATRDLDLLISADKENGKAAYAALAEFGAPLRGLTAEDLVEPGSFYRMGTPPVMVDILPRISGVDFDEAWRRRVQVAIDDALSVPFISREDLIAAKLAAGRPQDLADVAALGENPDNIRDAPHRSDTSGRDELEGARRKGREEWLKLRQQQAGNAEVASEDAHTEQSRDLQQPPDDGPDS